MISDRVGTVVFNYRLIRKLGEGGFGAVYLAEHEEIGRKAACKILHGHFAREPEVVDRFFREAKAVCAIGHRAIIDIENFGRLESGEPFCLMELFPGESLAERVARGPLPGTEVLTIFEPVASALTAAHEAGIIHRDLKPDNIMVLDDGGEITDVKLLDFGIAKLLDTTDSVSSRTGAMFGTPTYMAPEQARDAKNVDPRADVYGLAATVYACVAGRPPFKADSVTDIIVQVQTQPPPPLREYAPDAPAALEAIVAQCLEKRPEARPATVAEAWRAMRSALGGAPPRARSSSAPYAPYPDGAPIGAGATLAAPGGVPLAAPTPEMPVPATVAADAAPASPTTLGSATGSASTPPAPRSRRGAWVAAFAVAIAAGASVGGFFALRDDGAATLAAGPRGAQDAGPVQGTTLGQIHGAVDAAPLRARLDPDAAATDTAATDAAPPTAVTSCDVRVPRKRQLRPARVRALLRALDRCREAGSIETGEYAAIRGRLDAMLARATSPREPTEVPDEVPAPNCTAKRFVAVIDKRDPDEAEVRAALKALRQCRDQLGHSVYLQLQSELIAKL